LVIITESEDEEETDLTYEGIETFNSLLSILLFPQGEETDLTYEGIETHSRVFDLFICFDTKKPT